jgi:hypothetical protein
MTSNAEDRVMSSDVRKQRRYRPPIFHWVEFWRESSIVRAGAFTSAAIRVPAARVAADNPGDGRCPATSVVTAATAPLPGEPLQRRS